MKLRNGMTLAAVVALTLASAVSFADVDTSAQCPNLDGTYKSSTETLTITRKKDSNGQLVYSLARTPNGINDISTSDFTVDSTTQENNGALGPVSLAISCSNQTLQVSAKTLMGTDVNTVGLDKDGNLYFQETLTLINGQSQAQNPTTYVRQ